MSRGLFISFEGIEGTGKTTQARLLAARLAAAGIPAVLTQEPGGTVIGSRIREILLLPEHHAMSPTTELLLYNAARAQHLAEVILPALAAGSVVVTDRFSDSTVAYQGYARGIDRALIRSLDAVATGGMKPDLTLLFDLDVETGLMRNRAANKVDRLELEAVEFHRKVRQGYHEIARAEPERVLLVDAAQPPETVAEQVWEIVQQQIRNPNI